MRLNDLLHNDTNALSRLISEAHNRPVSGVNYFDGSAIVVASVTKNPQAIATHLVQSRFFETNRYANEPLLRLIGIWQEVAEGRGDEVSDAFLRDVVQNLTVTIIEGSQSNGKVVFLATYISRGIENAILKSKLANGANVSLSPPPIEATINIHLDRDIPDNDDESAEELTQELLGDINNAIERFCENNDIKINISSLRVLSAEGSEQEFEKAA
jgi:hypothetical protein